jgi:hypothetical protein
VKVAVLIVNHNQWDLTRSCVESVLASRGVEVLPLLADNASGEEPPAWALSLPGLRFVRLDVNTGFAGGNNRAFDLMHGDEAPFTLLLNNDAVVGPDTIADLAGLLERNPRAGISTPAIYYAGDTDRIWAAGATFIPSRMMFHQRAYRRRRDLPPEPVRTSFSTGCATMIRTDIYRRMGGLREDFFMYYEDADLCLRTSAEGWEIWLVPGAEVLHHVAVSSGGVMSPFAVYYSLRNRIVLAGETLAPARRAVFLLYLMGIVALKTLAFPATGRARLVPPIWKALVDGFSKRLGQRFSAAVPRSLGSEVNGGVRGEGSPGST